MLGIWGRAEGELHSWDFFCEGRHERDYPHPKYRDMGLSCPGSFPGSYFCSLQEALEAVMLLVHPPAHCPSPLPVTLPGVPDIIIIDLMLISLFIQEIKHVFDGEGQCTPTVSCAKDGLKQVIHKFLQGALGRRKRKGLLSNTLGQQRGRSLTNGEPLINFTSIPIPKRAARYSLCNPAGSQWFILGNRHCSDEVSPSLYDLAC